MNTNKSKETNPMIKCIKEIFMEKGDIEETCE